MTLPLYGFEATRRRPTVAVDRYGDSTPTGAFVDVPYPCHAQQTGTSEVRDDAGRVKKRTTWHFWFDADADLTSTDTLVFRGQDYEIDGDPTHWDALGFAYIELDAFTERG